MEREGHLYNSNMAEVPNIFRGNMSAKPLNGQEDEDHQSKQVMPQEFQEEVIRVIQTSLCNIAIQVRDLKSYVDNLLVQLSSEVDNTSWRHTALHRNVAQVMGATYKKQHLQAEKSKEASEATLPEKHVYSSQAVPVKMYKTSDVCGENLPLSIPTCYSQDDTGLKKCSDNSYSFGICKKDVITESIEQKQEKLKGQKCLYHPNESESVPLCQSVQNEVSRHCSQADCGDLSHSLVHQPVECFSFGSPSFTEISEILSRDTGKVLATPLHSSSIRTKDLEDTLKFTHYRIETGEKLQPKLPVQHKTEGFVSPITQPSPTPLPADWLARLRVSKRPNASTTFPSPFLSPSSSSLLRTPVASHSQRLQRTPEAETPITTPTVDLYSPTPALFQYCKTVSRDLFPPDEEKSLSPPKSPSVMSYAIEMKDTVTDHVGHASHIQSGASLVCPSESSSFAQSTRHHVTKLPRYSYLQTPKSSTLAPSRYPISASKPSAAPLSGHSTLMASQSSVPLSSSGQQTSTSLTQSRKCVSAQLARYPVAQSRSSGAQFASSSVAPAERTSGAQSTRNLVSPQQRSSSLKSMQSYAIQSLFSSASPPSSCVLHPQALSLAQPSQHSLSSGLKLSSSSQQYSVKQGAPWWKQ